MEKKKQGKKTKASSKTKKTKFCMHCGTEIKAGMKACPNCKKKQGGGFKTIAIILIIILLAVNAILLFLNISNETDITPSSIIDKIINNNKQQEPDQPQEEAAYSIGQPWVVDGQWSLTVNSMAATDQRNEYDERNPAQVFIIDYTYENLGYADKDGIMNGLFFDLSSGQIVDSAGVMGYSYPGDVTNYAQETPVGATCNAQTCIAVDNASTEVKIIMSQHDGTGAPHSATFVIPVS